MVAGTGLALGFRVDTHYHCRVLLSGLPFVVAATSRQSSMTPLALGVMVDMFGVCIWQLTSLSFPNTPHYTW